MHQHRQWIYEGEDEEAANRQTASLGAVAIILALLVSGLFLVHVLQSKARIEDCLLSGRTNCNLLVANPQPPYATRAH